MAFLTAPSSTSAGWMAQETPAARSIAARDAAADASTSPRGAGLAASGGTEIGHRHGLAVPFLLVRAAPQHIRFRRSANRPGYPGSARRS